MFQVSQTLHPVPTVFGAGFIAPRFESDMPAKLLAEDAEPVFKDFVNRLHALVWSKE